MCEFFYLQILRELELDDPSVIIMDGADVANVILVNPEDPVNDAEDANPRYCMLADSDNLTRWMIGHFRIAWNANFNQAFYRIPVAAKKIIEICDGALCRM